MSRTSHIAEGYLALVQDALDVIGAGSSPTPPPRVPSGRGFVLDWQGDKVMAMLNARLPGMTKRAAQHILTQANKTAPIETGKMIRSGAVSVGQYEVVIGYSAPYALRQHETLWYRHKAGKRAKWLELTLQEEQQTALRIIADEIRKLLRKR